MKLQDFRKKVFNYEQKIPPDLRDNEALDHAIAMYFEEKSIQDKDKDLFHLSLEGLQAIIQKAGYIHESIVPELSTTEELSLAFTPEAQITGEYLLRFIQPAIEHLRIQRFSQTTPPFDTRDAAAAWIEKESEQNRRQWEEAHPDKHPDSLARIQAIAKENGFEPPEWKRTTLPYMKQDAAWAKGAVTYPNTFLYTLAKESKQLAKYTGFDQAQLVLHVLTGKPLVYPRIKIQQHSHSYAVPGDTHLNRSAVTLTVNTGDITENELRHIRRKVKQITTGAKSQSFTENDYNVLYFIEQELGGVPSSHKMDFWRKAEQQWNEKYPEQAYNSTPGYGLRRKYYLLDERRSEKL